MAQVIIIDDSTVVINEVSAFLKARNIETICAASGKEGLDVLTKNPDIPLAIVDINMPDMDGLTMIENVRKTLPDLQASFIILTTEFDRESKMRGKSLGVKGWIIKPFNGDRAIGAINKILGIG